MSPRDRAVLALYRDGFDTAGIAELLSLSPTTVRRAIRDARDKDATVPARPEPLDAARGMDPSGRALW